MKVADPDKRKYFDLAQFVKERTHADGAIVVVFKGGDSRIAPVLPPEWLAHLPEILQSCDHQSTAFLRELAEETALVRSPGLIAKIPHREYAYFRSCAPLLKASGS